MSDPSRSQQRRLAFAVALTVVAVPTVWLLNDDERPDDISTVIEGTVELAVSDNTVSTAVTDTIEDPLGVPVPAHLERRVTIAPNMGGQIAVPDSSGTFSGLASFDYDIVASDLCYAAGAELGMFVTVVNLDNNRSTTCIATATLEAPSADVVLHPDRFAAIGDPTDAPVKVEYRW
ncbi:MAG: hypothetical protein O2925_01410 [Actinomycetota bacterium]|nr:hypothetical protein [Actinomycetota bacterium]MDA3015133.1 hypothetical protein [Actinomycetota bacterium]MDA3027429.1 hypothetical protein [Actinomycetota bacterium]